ncbi:MAG: polymer-forming cytoskeletal protein [Patescibacteria group bacterium]
MKKTRIIITCSLLIFFIFPISVLAFSVKAENSVYIGQDEIVEGNLYAAGSNIIVDGTVKGDVFCAGQTININGQVDGDVICAGQSLNINGEIGGSVRAAGNSISINSQIARNVQAFGASVILGKDASVGWDMLIAGAMGEIRGKINGDLHGAGANMIIAGEVGKNVRLLLDEKVRNEIGGKFETYPITITDGAKIGGDVVYTAGNEGLISDKATITGGVTHNLPKLKEFKRDKAIGWAWGKLYSIFAALVIGLVLVSIWRKQIKDLTDKMLDKAGISIAWGIALMFLSPILVILLMFTVIGIPLALLLFGVWIIALVLAKVLVGIMIGRAIIKKLWPKRKEALIWAMIIGIVILYLILSIPYIGWIITLVVLWWGLGGIWQYYYKK